MVNDTTFTGVVISSRKGRFNLVLSAQNIGVEKRGSLERQWMEKQHCFTVEESSYNIVVFLLKQTFLGLLLCIDSYQLLVAVT